MTIPVATVCARLGLDRVELGGKAWSTRRRAELWRSLRPSARLLFLGYTSRQPAGWLSLINSVQRRFGIDRLNHRHAIDPLIKIGWLIRAGDHGFERWLTTEGRSAQHQLRLALARQRNAA